MKDNNPAAREFPGLGVLPGAAVLILFLAIAPCLPAQEEVSSEAAAEAASPLERRLADLNATLDRMVRLLEQQLILQRTDLFYRRLEVLDSSLANDRRALREARERQRQEEAEAKSLDMMLEQFEDEMAKLEEDDENLGYLRMQRREMASRSEVLEDSRRELTVHISELESRIRRREEDLAALQEELSDL